MAQVNEELLGDLPGEREAFNAWYAAAVETLGAFTNQGRYLQAFRAGWRSGRDVLMTEHPTP